MINVEHITSRQNPLVKRFRDASREPGRDGLVLLDGAHLLDEALASGTQVEVAAFAEPMTAATLADLASRARGAGIRVVSVSPSVLDAMSPVRQPSGVVTIATVHSSSLEAALERKSPLVLVLIGVQDPGNVGTLARTAEASGATAMVTMSGTASPFGWKALRASMGSALRLPIALDVPAATLLDQLRARGIRLIGAAARGGMPLHQGSLAGPSAILLGGEGAGLPPLLLAACDATITIPMKPPVESLNVAVAGALVLFEAARQRQLRTRE